MVKLWEVWNIRDIWEIPDRYEYDSRRRMDDLEDPKEQPPTNYEVVKWR